MIKKGLHTRNKHRFPYDFSVLTEALPALKPFVLTNLEGSESIDFANPNGVKTLNKALLKAYYKIDNWAIPLGYLCPPIPSRAEYIHQVADILSKGIEEFIPKGKRVKILDIGVGANCIYPIIGHQEYGWQFVGADVDAIALKSVENIVAGNKALHGMIKCRLQPFSKYIFKNIIASNDYFDCTMCNPPFHSSLAEATKGAARKVTNLNGAKNEDLTLNFGGQPNELYCEGGEMAFIFTMIQESVLFKSNCRWFSTLVSKSDYLKKIHQILHNVNAVEVKTIPIEVGNKVSRIVFWTFLTEEEQQNWRK
ncbi:MAG: hypothetical protein RI894_231 [Bacteroidota bacterium]|jgi:23S rRNA (adenine1618-N6)-methyltransferase